MVITLPTEEASLFLSPSKEKNQTQIKQDEYIPTKRKFLLSKKWKLVSKEEQKKEIHPKVARFGNY